MICISSSTRGIVIFLAITSCGAIRTEKLRVETSSESLESVAEKKRVYPTVWIGHYEGTGEFYTRRDNSWSRDLIARVSIDRQSRLSGVIKVHRGQTHAPGFMIENLDFSSTTELVGENIHDVGGAYWRYEYKLRWVSDRLQGEVSVFRSKLGPPQEIWRFDLRDMHRPTDDPLP